MSEFIRLHPLVFTLQDIVTGCGFLAGIVVTGKAVAEYEDEKWWMYGVCPGGIAGSGETLNEAFADLRNRYKEALFDMAEEYSHFSEFESAVKVFFEEDYEENARWEDALKILRKNENTICEPFRSLPRKYPEDYEVGIRIDRLEKKNKSLLKPTDNIQDSFSKVA